MDQEEAKDAINKVANKNWPVKYTLGAAVVVVIVIWVLIKLIF